MCQKVSLETENLVIEQNFQLLTPPHPKKFWSLVFQVLMELDNFHQPLCKNSKTICRAKVLITDPSRF